MSIILIQKNSIRINAGNVCPKGGMNRWFSVQCANEALGGWIQQSEKLFQLKKWDFAEQYNDMAKYLNKSQ